MSIVDTADILEQREDFFARLAARRDVSGHPFAARAIAMTDAEFVQERERTTAVHELRRFLGRPSDRKQVKKLFDLAIECATIEGLPSELAAKVSFAVDHLGFVSCIHEEARNRLRGPLLPAEIRIELEQTEHRARILELTVERECDAMLDRFCVLAHSPEGTISDAVRAEAVAAVPKAQSAFQEIRAEIAYLRERAEDLRNYYIL